MDHVRRPSTQTKESGEAARLGGKKLARKIGRLLGLRESQGTGANLFHRGGNFVLIKTARAKRPGFLIPNSLHGKFARIVLAHWHSGELELRQMTEFDFHTRSVRVTTGNLADRARSITISQTDKIEHHQAFNRTKWHQIISLDD